MRVSAYEISETALWEHLFAAYEQAYSEAVESSVIRTNRAVLDEGNARNEQINFVRQQLFAEKPNWNRMMVEQDPAQAPACPGRAFAQPLVVLEPRAPRPVRRHRPGTLGRMRAQPDRFPRQTERGTHEGARTRRGFPRAARRRICAVPRLYERKARPEDPHDFVLFQWNTACTRRSRSTRAAWAYSRATTSRRPRTRTSRWQPWACFTGTVTSRSVFRHRGRRRRPTRHRISINSRSRPCATRPATG